MTGRKRVVVEVPQPVQPGAPPQAPQTGTSRAATGPRNALPAPVARARRQGPDPRNYEPALMVVVHKDFAPKVQKIVRRFLWDWPVHGLDKALKNVGKR